MNASPGTVAPLVDADRVIEAEYEAFRPDVLRAANGKLAASKINFADLDMDGFYNQAWYGLYTKLQDGQQIESRKALLVQMTYRRAIDEYRRLHPDRHADPVVLETVGHEDPIEATLDQQQEFRHFVEGMRSSLNQRELQAATLCYVYGMSRPEAAEQVGVRPKRMEKIMDEVSRKMRPVLASIKEGNWCEDRAVLINQFALGALEPGSEDHEEALRHLEGCPGCRRHVVGTRGLVAVTLPSAVMLIAMTGAAAAAAGAGVASASAGAGGGAAAGAGGTAGAGAAAGGVAGMGVAAQAVAVVAAVAAVAAGGYVAADQITGSGEKDSGGGAAAAPAAPANPAGKAAAAGAAKKAATKKKKKAKKASKAASTPPVEVTPEPEPVEPVAPAEPQYTPERPSKDSGAEFDLQ
jgi:RNA polymerase sigma factor (sigma-70 family)